MFAVRRMARVSTLVALLMATILIVGQVAASAEVIHNKSIRNFEFTQILTNPCDGHAIEFSGTFQVVDQFIANEESTTFHTSTSFKGVTGVDLVTGEVVHWAESGTAIVSLSRERQDFRNVSTLDTRWVRPGPGNDVRFVGHFVFVIDASGNIRVDDSSFEISCGL